MKSSTSENIIEQISATLDRLHSLTILREVLHDSLAATMLTLLRELAAPEADATIVANAYSRLFNELAQASNSDVCIRGISDAWQAYLISCIVDDTNPLSTQAEIVGAARIAPNIYTQAQHDLLVLQSLCALTAPIIWETVRQTVASSLPALYDAWVPWENLAPSTQDTAELTARDRMGQRLAAEDAWSTLVDDLVAYWSRHGTGLFAR